MQVSKNYNKDYKDNVQKKQREISKDNKMNSNNNLS